MARDRIDPQGGFTLVEVMVAIAVLLVGVLGAVALIDGANAQTSRTKAREGATALARSVLEIGRGVPYGDLTAARILEELDARGAGFADVDGAAGHQVRSRGFVYNVTPTVCAMDDPKDSLGTHDEVGVTFCADSDQVVGSPSSVDRNPDDYRRMAIDLTWRAGTGPLDSARQTGIVTNPVGGLGPSVLSLKQTMPADDTDPVSVTAGVGADYELVTSTTPDDVAWSVKGNRMGSATGTGTRWSFSWDLGHIDAPLVPDCTYVLQAQAFDDKARAGAARALTVTVNRRQPFGPRKFVGGANLRPGRDVDLQWDANLECDISWYRVFRGVGGGPLDTQVCQVLAGAPTECVDQSPPAGELTYRVVAYDRSPDGALRIGDQSAEAVVVPSTVANDPPATPASLSVCTGGSFAGACDDIEGNPAPDGTAVLSWPAVADPDADGDEIRFYRVYRAASGIASPGYEHRLDVLFPVFDGDGEPVTPLVFVDDTATTAHRYWVTAVDDRFGESAPVGPVAWGAP
jgi:prepilin-type N-terminal cleavage/methylation domain-containing protein